jgi:hypothetical protein
LAWEFGEVFYFDGFIDDGNGGDHGEEREHPVLV